MHRKLLFDSLITRHEAHLTQHLSGLRNILMPYLELRQEEPDLGKRERLMWDHIQTRAIDLPGGEGVQEGSGIAAMYVTGIHPIEVHLM